MTLPTNENFERLLQTIKRMDAEASQKASDTDAYRSFIAKFPLSRLPGLRADEYCVGKGVDESFCRWIERGLEPAIGRYMPGTSRGHIVYFRKEDGSFYKNQLLQGLSDEDALRYTLKIQSVIAAANVNDDIKWIDNDAEIYRRAGVEPLVTVGDGRKLRLLACYHPDEVIPISSSEHLGHYLEALGCAKADIPDEKQPVSRMLKLREYYTLARQSMPTLSTRGFMRALYSPTLGIAPEPSAETDDEDPATSAYLLTWNPDQVPLGGDGEVVPGTEQQWTCHSRRPKVGDTVYLARLGVDPRGIVAKGIVTEASHEAPHWKNPSKPARYIRFKVEEFRATAASGLLPMVLLNSAIPGQRWSPQSSGIGLSLEVEPVLRALWKAGAGIHSLRQYVTWLAKDMAARGGEALNDYQQVTTLAKALRDDPSRIDEAALDRLWRIPDNGVAHVGPGAMSNKDFKDNLSLLTDMTRDIVASPTSETLADVEARWQRAVTAKAMSKMKHVVIRRVFSAASPASFTSLLRESDCQKVLALLKRQFQLSPSPMAGGDWVGLNANIASCLKQAELVPDQVLESNIALWKLVEPGSQVEPPEPVGPKVPKPGTVEPGRSSPMLPINLVLYGPPGTGKTYQTIDEAIRILAPELLEGEPDRPTLKARFDAFVKNGQIVFTTFHQSFSYEDFVEGLRADTDESGQLRYHVVDGVFKQICGLNSRPPATKDLSPMLSPFEVGEVFSGYQVKRATADILELKKPNGSELPIGMSLLANLADLVQSRLITIDDIREKRVFDKVPETRLERFLVHGYNNILPALVERMVAGERSAPLPEPTPSVATPRVLIIDEINRGNVSRIFGELITLIEPSKRAGMPEALEVTLPYSKELFSVPANLHIIATMNTADRSLVGMDIALRRRFEFRELEPRHDLLEDVSVDGVSIGKLLSVLNERIEMLLDRDHRLGHALFWPLHESPTLTNLARIFRANVLPLLQEYFFEDWNRIRWVLNDHRKAEAVQFITVIDPKLDELFGSDVSVNGQRVRWYINDQAFSELDAYSGIIKASA